MGGEVVKNESEVANRARWLCGALAAMNTLALAACGHSAQAVRAPGATAQGSAQAVAHEDPGVRVVAKARNWSGDPPTLSRYVLPIWIQIENHSGKPLWLGYSGLRVEDSGDSHVMLSAVPPVNVKGKAITPLAAVPPDFRLDDPWWGTWLEPEFEYYVARNVHWEESLPTKEMLRRAIREGVVADGKKVVGFVYFQEPKLDHAALTLRVDLVDAMTKQSFGQVEIPLPDLKN
jgi:hypothetical protein